jgi:ABC-2 type transport system permease protein
MSEHEVAVDRGDRQSLGTEIAEDFRHICINISYEMRKHLRRKRIYIAIFMAIFLPLITYAIPYLMDIAPPNRWEDFASTMLSFINYTIIIGCALLIADSVSSEFEMKTAFITYTSPQRKTSIFIGKFLAGILLVSALVTVYYIITLVALAAHYGIAKVEIDFLVSYMLAIIYVFFVGSLAFFFSSIFKKSVIALILVLIILVLILSSIYGVHLLVGIKPWYMPNFCAETIITIFGRMEMSIDMEIYTMVIFVPEYVRSVLVLLAYSIFLFVSGLIIGTRRQVQ